jgi:hypothetical protein
MTIHATQTNALCHINYTKQTILAQKIVTIKMTQKVYSSNAILILITLQQPLAYEEPEQEDSQYSSKNEFEYPHSQEDELIASDIHPLPSHIDDLPEFPRQ